MPYYATTPNMNLRLPNILQDPGPTWANDLNATISAVDTHDHTSSKGKQVPTAGININANLPFNNYGSTGVAYATYNAAASVPPSSTLLNSVFVAQVAGRNELFYQDSQGVNVQLTSTGAVNQNSTSPSSNGFSGSGYNTSSGARSVWNASPGVYTFTSNGTALASLSAANYYATGLLYTAAAGSLASPSQGFAIQGTSGALTVFYDTGTGSFTSKAFQYLTGSSPGFVVNPASVLDSSTASLDAYATASTGSALVTQRLLSKFGTVTNGQGPAFEFWSNSNSTTYLRQAQITSYWASYGSTAGMRFYVANAGTLASTPALDLQNSGGGFQSMGLLGQAPGTDNIISVYGSMIPNGSQNLGDPVSTPWLGVYTSTLGGPSTSDLTILAASSHAVKMRADNGVNLRNTADTAWAPLQAGTGTLNGSLQVNGNIFATGTISGSSRGFVVGFATCSPSTGNVGVTGTGLTAVYNSTGNYTFTITNPPTSGLWAVTTSVGGSTSNYTYIVHVTSRTSTTFTIETTTGNGSPQDLGFDVIVAAI